MENGKVERLRMDRYGQKDRGVDTRQLNTWNKKITK